MKMALAIIHRLEAAHQYFPKIRDTLGVSHFTRK
jgi:hypothetical protein